MKLTYRGNDYQLQSTLKRNSSFTGVVAKYRGISYCVLLTTLKCDRPLVAYKYRGINYIKENWSEKSKNAVLSD